MYLYLVRRTPNLADFFKRASDAIPRFRLLSPGSTGRQSKSTDSRQEVDSRQQVDSNSSIALSTSVNLCQPKVDSHHVCPLSTTVNHGRQWSTGSTGAAGSTGSTGRQREWVDSGKYVSITDLHVSTSSSPCIIAALPEKWQFSHTRPMGASPES